MPRFVTIKEIADKLEWCDDTVRRHRRQLGLDQCRDKIQERPERFFTEKVERALRENGHEVAF